ncbi:MAG: tetratricopeptide repeat protein [Candidatus Eisenbacteria bacterium]
MGAAFAAATLVVFAPVLAAGFVPWDDGDNVFENAVLRRPLPDALRVLWSHPVFASYVPVTRTVWALLWGAGHEPVGFHAVNLVLHVVNVLLAWGLLRRLGSPVVAAAMGAALFAIHPFQVEPVAWVTGLKDVLGATFSLVALDGFTRDAIAAARPAGRGSAPVLVVATLAYVAALLSKASSVAVPVMALAVGAGLRAPWRRTLVVCVSWLALAVPIVLVTRVGEQAEGRPFTIFPIMLRPWIALDALGFYLTRLLAPFDLSLDHGRTPAWVMAHHGSWPVALLPIVVAVTIAFAGRRRRALAVGAALFALALAPVLGLVPFLHQNISTVADRYVYLAMIGPAMAVAIAWDSWRAPVARALIVLALAGFTALSVVQLRCWRDGDHLFDRVLSVNPRSWLAHNNRGVAFGKAGHVVAAAAEFRTALVLAPHLPEAHSNLGNALYLLDRPDSAIVEWRTAIELLPTLESPHRNLGQVLAVRGDTAGAARELRAALRISPDDSVSAAALRALGEPPPAPPR